MKRKSLLRGFLNPYQKKICRGFIHYLLWRFGYYKEKAPLPPIPEGFIYPNTDGNHDYDIPYVTWINHSSFLVDMAGTRFVVDPIWNERCSPVSFLGPKRHHPPPFDIKDLGRVDYIILSHNHYDHLDRRTLKQFNKHYPEITWVVPLKIKKWLLKQFPQIERGWVIELDWWEQFQTKDLTFTAVPAQHFSGRGLLDRNRSLWMGCVVESNKLKKRFYFAGDTGYNEHDFKKIGNRFQHIDLALLPIGVYRPRKFMRAVHINPDEAVAIHRDVNANLSIGGHWGTFKLSSDCLTRPPYDLHCALEKQGLTWENFRILKPGQSINW